MSVRRLTADLAVRADALIGEGPFWRPELERLDWVDIERGLLHGSDLATGTTTSIPVSDVVGSAIPTAAGDGWVCGVRDGLAFLDQDGDVVETLSIEAEVTTNRMNDAACDAAGRLWTGTMDVDGRPHRGALYRVDPDRTVTRILDSVSLSNGIGWSPDGRVLHHVDSTARTVTAYEFDVDAGALGPVVSVIEIDDSTPDGLAVDIDGGLWVAMWGGAQVRRLTPEGAVDTVVDVPAPQVTSVAFCDTSLLITTARIGLDDATLEASPLSGSVFRAEVGVDGVAVHRFG